MIFRRVNIVDKLTAQQIKELAKEKMMEEVSEILQEPSTIERMYQPSVYPENQFNLDLLEAERIFHISQIEKICINYRLRFLSLYLFKGTLPIKAIENIKSLENDHRIHIQNLKIIAPSRLFRLNSADDPALFAPMGNEYYYLVHQWGKDLHPFRKLLMFPFKNYLNLLFFVFIGSFFITKVIPLSLFTRHPQDSYFWILFLFNFKGISSILLFYCVSCGKNVSSAVWKSKYFNA